MAIECLAYELLQSHQDEVDYGTMETWQPGRLIKELKEIDSGIESDRSISIGVEDFPGEPAEKMLLLGTDGRLTASWINKHWNALGSYLHEPTIKQHNNGKVFNADSARAKIATISGEIDRVLASTLFATNITVKSQWTANVVSLSTAEKNCSSVMVKWFAPVAKQSGVRRSREKIGGS